MFVVYSDMEIFTSTETIVSCRVYIMYKPVSFTNEFIKNNENSKYLLHNNNDYLLLRSHIDF